MSEWNKSDEFDEMISRSMRRRPEPIVAGDLAQRAIQIGSQPATPEWMRRANAAVTIAALGLFLSVSLWLIRTRLASGGFSNWWQGSSSGSASDNTTSSSPDWMVIVAILAVAAVVITLVQRTLAGAEPEFGELALG
jgi:hypothetical protein